MSGRDVADECWPGRNIEAEAVDMMSPSSRRKRTMVELVLSFLNTAAPLGPPSLAAMPQGWKCFYVRSLTIHPSVLVLDLG